MKCTILSVGTELLFGQIVNTNTVYLSQQLNLLGIDVMSHHTIGDNPTRLAELLSQIRKECDLIITTGGLGPTQDDLTKETVCEVFHDQLVLHQPSYDQILAFFNKLGRTMTENNAKQALLPSRATVLKNHEGTAPGFALSDQGCTILCMPGPPREMKAMFEREAKPYLSKKVNAVIYYRMFRTFGIGESQLETDLIDLIDAQTDPTLATYAKEGECSLRIASKRSTLEEAQAAVEQMAKLVRDRIGAFLYSEDDEELHQVVGKKLLQKNLTISCAESCTGGGFSQSLTSIPGISAVFDRGFVTYSNRSKTEELGVNIETLEKFGAVSAETAAEMAEGVKRCTGSDLCISVTGIAGPEGGTPEKPVGLLYLGACYQGKTIVVKRLMRSSGRDWNRNYARLWMFDLINRLIDEKEIHVE